MKRRDVSRTLIAIRGITRLILDGELRAGDRVSQVNIASLLGLDRASVQLAFERLKRQGVLEPVTAGGFVVRSFTLRQVEDAIFLRGQFEASAARLAAARRSSAGVRDLMACVTALDLVVDDTAEDPELSLQRYRELNEAFHLELFALAASDALTAAYESLVALPFAQPSALLVYGDQYPILSVPIQFAQFQHRKILKAIQSGDSEGAERSARDHADLARHDLHAVMRRGAEIGMLPGSGLIVSTQESSEIAEEDASSAMTEVAQSRRREAYAAHAPRWISSNATPSPRFSRSSRAGVIPGNATPSMNGGARSRSVSVKLHVGQQMPESDGHRSGVQVISRVALIMQLLTGSGSGLTLAEVVTSSGLPKTTVHRILSALQEERLVESAAGRYRLGRVLGREPVAETEQVRMRTRPLMERVATEIQETVDLTILVDDQVMIIEQVLRRRGPTEGPVVGSRLPALGTASGLALLACSPEHERSVLVTPDLRVGTDVTRDDLAERLARVREDEIAVSVEDIPGIVALATAATDETGVAFALGVPVPRDRSVGQAPVVRRALLRARPEFEHLVANT